MNIERIREANRDEVIISHGRANDHVISVRCTGADPLAAFHKVQPARGIIAGQLVFGGCGYHTDALARMGRVDWPVMWVQGDSCSGDHIAGMQWLKLSGIQPRRIQLDGETVGSAWSDADADYCMLFGVGPVDAGASRADQTYDCFQRIERALQQGGMEFAQVVRTWFYLDHLLDWYDTFNTVRTAFFNERGVFEGLVPASTGIGASNPRGTALIAGALAVRPTSPALKIFAVPSPLQCPATDYKSSFSRAVELAYPHHRQLLISGTASIAPEGETLHVGDCGKQIDLTLEVVEAILTSRGMTWADTSRAVAYFENMYDLPLFDACLRARGIPDFPVTPAHATVCRDNLLFELELDAIRAVKP